MTNYNKRLDEVFERLYRIAADTELASDRFDPYSFNGVSEAKQALTSLIKELVAEAKPEDNCMDCNGVMQYEQNLFKALEKVNR